MSDTAQKVEGMLKKWEACGRKNPGSKSDGFFTKKL